MDNQRLLIWAIFGVLAWMTYQAWMQDYAPAATTAPTEVVAPGEQVDTSLPALSDAAPAPAPDVPGELPSLATAGARADAGGRGVHTGDHRHP